MFSALPAQSVCYTTLCRSRETKPCWPNAAPAHPSVPAHGCHHSLNGARVNHPRLVLCAVIHAKQCQGPGDHAKQSPARRIRYCAEELSGFSHACHHSLNSVWLQRRNISCFCVEVAVLFTPALRWSFSFLLRPSMHESNEWVRKAQRQWYRVPAPGAGTRGEGAIADWRSFDSCWWRFKSTTS